MFSRERLAAASHDACVALLAERDSAGCWLGELSTSALATATAVSAFALVQRRTMRQSSFESLVSRGITWLVRHQNSDGGWGDTALSVSNISTSMLVWAALHLTDPVPQQPECVARLQAYLRQCCGKTPAEQAEAIRARYGKDRTFAVPILTTCALANLIPWTEVPSLPFELACFPQSWFRFLQLPVVSYALPALIAIGQAVFHHRPPWNPLARCVRWMAWNKSLRVLEAIQPSSGGFLEATPLTSFVTLSLASIGHADHPVARKGIDFLMKSVRLDGSWPIDSNLATWVTTLSVNALAAAGSLDTLNRRQQLTDWVLRQQFNVRHPYTGADPGGWGWTDLPGSVPDADDTAGSLLALASLARLDGTSSQIEEAARNGLRWLLDLQNRDGGWPTFCRGWGNLPFDRSGADLTAHVLRAIATWNKLVASVEASARRDREQNLSKRLDELSLTAPLTRRADASTLASSKVQIAIANGLAYLGRVQRADGSWLPLWFGNQYAPDDLNATYGTCRVLAAYRDLDMMNTEPARRGVAWLLSAQNDDGGWGGLRGTPSSMEETGVAVDLLLDAGPDATSAVNRGLAWLVQGVESGSLHRPAPIGLYFAKLWYFEKLYPIIFTVSALGRACKNDALRQPQHLDSTPP